MTELSLRGQASYVDDKGNLVVSFLEEYPDAKASLIRCASSGTFQPFDEKTFRVTCKGVASADQLDHYLGRDITVKVKVTPYRFTSKAKWNAGTSVTGCKLALLDLDVIKA
jgi:hypothetical protein